MLLLHNVLASNGWQLEIADLMEIIPVSDDIASKFFHHFFYVPDGIAI